MQQSQSQIIAVLAMHVEGVEVRDSSIKACYIFDVTVDVLPRCAKKYGLQGMMTILTSCKINFGKLSRC